MTIRADGDDHPHGAADDDDPGHSEDDAAAKDAAAPSADAARLPQPGALDSRSRQHGDDERAESARERYAREHPAGYLASRKRPPVAERVGHPLVADDPGFGPFGERRLAEGEREFDLHSAAPVKRVRKPETPR
jgi:hypothetical protein